MANLPPLGQPKKLYKTLITAGSKIQILLDSIINYGSMVHRSQIIAVDKRAFSPSGPMKRLIERGLVRRTTRGYYCATHKGHSTNRSANKMLVKQKTVGPKPTIRVCSYCGVSFAHVGALLKHCKMCAVKLQAQGRAQRKKKEEIEEKKPALPTFSRPRIELCMKRIGFPESTQQAFMDTSEAGKFYTFPQLEPILEQIGLDGIDIERIRMRLGSHGEKAEFGYR